MSSGSNDTTIWKLKKVKAIDPIIDDAVKSLAELEIIKYVRVTDNSIQASNELAGNKRKLPVTEPFHPSAVGIYLVYDFEYKVVQIMEINSAVRGWGEKLVQASLMGLPQDWKVAVVFDWSSGFWDKMEQKFNHIRWMRA
ncbi:MAG: hypothetical protein Q7J06_01290 [Bacteroidales bacterium]|nr:hypothetical protein [Bacteroidales bacterium]